MPTNKYPNIGYTTYGVDWNCYQKFTVTATSFGGGSVDGYQPDFIVTFPTQGFILLNETATSTVQVSYNGITVHDEINSAVMPSFTYNNRILTKIWFRVAAGSVTVSLRAWART